MSVTMLTYRGEGAYRPGLPARDLDRADLEVLSQNQGRSVDEIVAEGVGSGLYLATLADDDEPAPVEGSARNDASPADPIDQRSTTRPQLVDIAKELGLEPATSDTKAAIVTAIKAERQRRADEAAASEAAETSSSGAGTGDEGTPADPDADASGEAGSSPDEGAGA